MKNFDLNFLDHVAIRSSNLDVSVAWYERVLGLKKTILPEWGNSPVMMLSGKCGVAIFPAKESDISNETKKIRIDHFAFNVNEADFKKAMEHFVNIEQDFKFQDHTYFHSVYIKDPDGHTVELTTITVDENSFYK